MASETSVGGLLRSMYHETMAISDMPKNRRPNETSNIADLIQKSENMSLQGRHRQESQPKARQSGTDNTENSQYAAKISLNEEPGLPALAFSFHTGGNEVTGKRNPQNKTETTSTGLVSRSENRELQLSSTGETEVLSNPLVASCGATEGTIAATPSPAKDHFDSFEYQKLAFNVKKAHEYTGKTDAERVQMFIEAVIKILKRKPLDFNIVTSDGCNLADWHIWLLAAKLVRQKFSEALQTAQELVLVLARLEPIHNKDFLRFAVMDRMYAYIYQGLGDLETAKDHAERAIRVIHDQEEDASQQQEMRAAIDIIVEILQGLNEDAEIEFYLSLRPAEV